MAKKKKKAGTSHTSRTLERLRLRGFQVWVVEKFLPHVRRGDGGWGGRQDMFGWCDIVAIDPKNGVTIGVQSTGDDYANHLRKLTIERAVQVREWLQAGNRAELYAWRKVKKKRGGKQMVYRPRWKSITMQDVHPDIYL